MSAYGFWFYNLAFLCMPPKFLCNYVGQEESFACRQQEFCGNPDLEWMIDYSDPWTLHNWTEKLSLVCKPSWQIGLLGSAYFGGWALTLLWLPSYADRYGRVQFYRISNTFWTLTFTIMIFSSNFWLVVFASFLTGFFASI